MKNHGELCSRARALLRKGSGLNLWQLHLEQPLRNGVSSWGWWEVVEVQNVWRLAKAEEEGSADGKGFLCTRLGVTVNQSRRMSDWIGPVQGGGTCSGGQSKTTSRGVLFPGPIRVGRVHISAPRHPCYVLLVTCFWVAACTYVGCYFYFIKLIYCLILKNLTDYKNNFKNEIINKNYFKH